MSKTLHDLSVAEAERQLGRVRQELSRYRELQERAARLQQFIDLGRSLVSPDGLSATDSQPTGISGIAGVGKRKKATPDYALQVLRDNQPAHIDVLFRLMRSAGWKGSGNDQKDRHNLAVTLIRRAEFHNSGQNTWSLIAEK